VLKVITAFPEIRHVASFNVVLRAPVGGLSDKKNWSAVRVLFLIKLRWPKKKSVYDLGCSYYVQGSKSGFRTSSGIEKFNGSSWGAF